MLTRYKPLGRYSNLNVEITFYVLLIEFRVIVHHVTLLFLACGTCFQVDWFEMTGFSENKLSHANSVVRSRVYGTISLSMRKHIILHFMSNLRSAVAS